MQAYRPAKKRRNQFTETGLTPKQERFAREYVVDFDAAAAAVRAGYSQTGASQAGARLLVVPKMTSAIQHLIHQASERTAIDQDYVLCRLRENVERAMQRIPVLNSAGEAVGMYTYEGAIANKALELLGKHVGMFGVLVKHDHEHKHQHAVIKLSDLNLNAEQKRAIGLQALEILKRQQGQTGAPALPPPPAPASSAASALTSASTGDENAAIRLLQKDPGPDRSS